MRRQLVREAEAGPPVAHQAEGRLVLAPRVLAAPVLDVNHHLALVREAKGGAGVAGVSVDGVTGASRLPAEKGGEGGGHRRRSSGIFRW